MRILCLLIFSFFMLFFSFSQVNNDCDWEVVNTANNAIIAIQQDSALNFSIVNADWSEFILLMSQFNCPATLGVFYTDDNGGLICGGMTQWDNTQSMAIAAWGDDPTTPEKDGFSTNEPYVFKLCVNGLGELASEVSMSSDTPFTDYYTTNGFGLMNSIVFSLPIDWEDWALANNCDGIISLEDSDKSRYLVRTVDVYGRDISSLSQRGLQINIYSDLTTKKLYHF